MALYGGQRELGIPEPHEPGHIRECRNEVRAKCQCEEIWAANSTVPEPPPLAAWRSTQTGGARKPLPAPVSRPGACSRLLEYGELADGVVLRALWCTDVVCDTSRYRRRTRPDHHWRCVPWVVTHRVCAVSVLHSYSREAVAWLETLPPLDSAGGLNSGVTRAGLEVAPNLTVSGQPSISWRGPWLQGEP